MKVQERIIDGDVMLSLSSFLETWEKLKRTEMEQEMVYPNYSTGFSRRKGKKTVRLADK